MPKLTLEELEEYRFVVRMRFRTNPVLFQSDALPYYQAGKLFNDLVELPGHQLKTIYVHDIYGEPDVFDG
jgi:hypothetical protein